jgi:hypothetical protein
MRGRAQRQLHQTTGGFNGSIHSLGSSFGAVVIKGPISHTASEKALEAGSYFSSKGESLHAPRSPRR